MTRTDERRAKRRRGEQAMVPEARFTSYYGMPVLNRPVWKALDIAGYLFLGGLAGGSSLLAAGAHATGRRALARAAKTGAFGAISLSLAALVHDLGRPARFLNMLRVAKPTSPMSVGSWLLACYGPLAGAAAATEATGRFPRLGALATAGAAVLGPAVTTYTAVLLSDTAVPSWHEGHREMPFLFAGSGAAAAAGLALICAPAPPARRMGVLGAAAELGAARVMKKRMGLASEPLEKGAAGRLMRASEILTATGAVLAALSGAAGSRAMPMTISMAMPMTISTAMPRAIATAAGAALLGGSAALRFGVFHAGVASAQDPVYTVVPQRERLEQGRGFSAAAHG